MINDLRLKPIFIEYCVLCFDGGFIIDNENRTQMQAWLDNFKKSNRGILVAGNSGSGKTLPFEVMVRILHPRDIKQFRIISTRAIVSDYNANSDPCLRSYIGRNCLFDDLGTEDNGKFYAHQQKNVMEDIIQMAYEDWRARGTKYHWTTNFSHQKIKDRYGLRCFTRLQEMSIEIELGATKEYSNRRELNNFKGWVKVLHEPRIDEWDFSSPKQPEIRTGEVFQISKFTTKFTDHDQSAK